MNLAATLRALAEAQRAAADAMAALAGELEAAPTGTHAYYDRDHLPPGEKTWRAVIERARRGAYELVKVGRHVVVPRASYENWLETKRTTHTTRPTRLSKGDLDVLRELGGDVAVGRP